MQVAYYAVIFTSQLAAVDAEGYAALAKEMAALAERQPGFLGIESQRDAAGRGITISYWQTEADIAAWKAHAAHLVAQEQGKASLYSWYKVEVAAVFRTYSQET